MSRDRVPGSSVIDHRAGSTTEGSGTLKGRPVAMGREDDKKKDLKKDPKIQAAKRMGQAVRDGDKEKLAKEVDAAKAKGWDKDK
jgi:hypothetical protein